MRSEARFSIRLFLALALVALAFIGASAYANWRAIAIDAETEALLSDALPSTDRLAAAVDALRDLEAATDDYPEVPVQQRAAARANIERLWREVDTDLAGYVVLPAVAGERAMYSEVPSSLRELDGAVQRLFAEVESGALETARVTADRAVRVKTNRTAQMLRQLVRLNVAHAVESSLRIRETRRQMVIVAVILDGVTFAFTGAVAVWLWRLFRGYAELQRAHADLVTRRADELEVFGRRVAHDLLSPISSLSFCLSAFKRVSEGDPKLESALARARQCVMRAQALVDNVFDFARSGGTPRSDARAEVREVVEQVVDDARAVDASERPEIEVAALPDCAVRCSRGVLASVLGNLVRNAAKYMRDSAERRIAIRVLEGEDEVRFEVEDTGPGVPPGLERAIWEPYVRGEGVTQPGLGLGLATVKRFCEAHGGSVGLRSVTGHGSVFHFTLPKAREVRSGVLPPVSAKLIRGAVS